MPGNPDLLDPLLGVSLEEDDDGVESGVVELVDGRRRHVQQGVRAALHDALDGGEAHDAGVLALLVSAMQGFLLWKIQKGSRFFLSG